MIGLASSFGIEKEILAIEFCKECDFNFVTFSSSAVVDRLGFDPQAEYDFKLRLFIQNKILDAAELLYKRSHVNFITDKTPLDMLAFTMTDIQRYNIDSDGAAMFMDYIERCFEVTNRYFASLVVVQPSILLSDDLTQVTGDMAYREHINAIVLGLVVDPRIMGGRHFIPREMSNVNDRVSSVFNSINSVSEQFNSTTTDKKIH